MAAFGRVIALAGKKKTTIRFGNWKLEKVDPLNWALASRTGKVGEDGEMKGGWSTQRNYFGKVVDAAIFARDREFDRGGDFETLDAYIAELRKADKAFVRDLRKALEEAGVE